MTSRQARSEYARRAGPAVRAVGVAIKSGRLAKQPCEDCGSLAVQAHHPRGYDRDHALDVEWLCRPHHMARHGRATGRTPSRPTSRKRHSWEIPGEARLYMQRTGRTGSWAVASSHSYTDQSSPRHLLRTIERVWSYLRTDEERLAVVALVLELAGVNKRERDAA